MPMMSHDVMGMLQGVGWGGVGWGGVGHGNLTSIICS